MPKESRTRVVSEHGDTLSIADLESPSLRGRDVVPPGSKGKQLREHSVRNRDTSSRLSVNCNWYAIGRIIKVL